MLVKGLRTVLKQLSTLSLNMDRYFFKRETDSIFSKYSETYWARVENTHTNLLKGTQIARKFITKVIVGG